MEKFLEILLGMLNAVRQTLFAEDAEETLDQVHPRGVCGRVVKINLRMATQPVPSRLVLVDVQVVHDDVESAIRIGSYDFIHEWEKVHRGAPVTDMSDHFTGGDLQGSDQRLCSVSDVFVGRTWVSWHDGSNGCVRSRA